MTNEHYAYILTVDEKYWNRLCQRNSAQIGTHVFIRKNQVAPKEVDQLLFYVTRKKQVLGAADFLERLTGNYEDLWEKFGSESCFESFEEYKSFADGRLKMTFIRFSNFREIDNPKSKEEVSKVLGSLRGFGAGNYLDNETVMQLV
jgi:predicted transcriptional regulator